MSTAPSQATAHEAAIRTAMDRGDLACAALLAVGYCAAAGPVTSESHPTRSTWFRAAYLVARVSLAAGRLAQALDRLAPLIGREVFGLVTSLLGGVRAVVAGLWLR